MRNERGAAAERELDLHTFTPEVAGASIVGMAPGRQRAPLSIRGTAKLAYLEDNLGAARDPLPDEATRKKMVALLKRRARGIGCAVQGRSFAALAWPVPAVTNFPYNAGHVQIPPFSGGPTCHRDSLL